MHSFNATEKYYTSGTVPSISYETPSKLLALAVRRVCVGGSRVRRMNEALREDWVEWIRGPRNQSMYVIKNFTVWTSFQSREGGQKEGKEFFDEIFFSKNEEWEKLFLSLYLLCVSFSRSISVSLSLSLCKNLVSLPLSVCLSVSISTLETYSFKKLNKLFYPSRLLLSISFLYLPK